MKLYNRELEEIQNEDKEKNIQSIAEKNIVFLIKKYGIDEHFLRERLEKLAVVEREGKTHFVVKNGIRYEIQSESPAAFVTKKSQVFDGQKWHFENGVYINDTNGEHVITHEMFHYFSANTEMDFDVDGIGYDKKGISIAGYNREDEDVNVGLNANGLNEGITEMLAMQVDQISTPFVYEKQVYLASILTNSQDNSLITAYFSSDKSQFNNFLKDFDRRQAIISSEKLVSLSTEYGAMDVEILKGCLEYSLSFCNDMDKLKEERNRLLPIFKNMSNSASIYFTDEDFDVRQFFNDRMSAKKKEIQERIEVQNEKSGLDDCMKDSTVRISNTQEATRVVKEEVLGKDRVIDENAQQK